MRILVRNGVRISLSTAFLRAIGAAPDTSKDKVLCLPIHPSLGEDQVNYVAETLCNALTE